MNNFKVEIYNDESAVYEDYSRYAVFPLKIADLLDEQLDEAELTLKYTNKAFIRPLTLVKITVDNLPKAKYINALEVSERSENKNVEIYFDSNTKRIKQRLVREFIVANDRAIEQRVGSELYTHQLYLIELTKILEGYICESITFTNPLSNLGQISNFAQAVFNFTIGSVGQGDAPSYVEASRQSSFFPGTVATGSYTFPTPETIGSNESVKGLSFSADIKETITNPEETSVTLKTNGTNVPISDNKAELASQVYQIVYYYKKQQGSFLSGYYTVKGTITYTFKATENRLPIKKWTIADVINRVFDIVVTRTKDDLPKFRLKGNLYNSNNELVDYEENSLAWKLNKIISPEFTFTKMNLREILKQIGGYIHAEPRIVEKEKINGQWIYTIDYDFYGNNIFSNITKKHRISATFGTDINEYCTSLDSSADNLVNRLNWASGVITEPFITNGVGKGIRTETATVRIEENNSAVISTKYPIYEIKKVKAIYKKPISDFGVQYDMDITPYIFEQADYELLSSYKGAYPYVKSYALYYTQGAKSIKGLFFKPSTANSAISPIFEKYALLNILNAVEDNIDKDKLESISDYVSELSFVVTYVPIFSTRVKTNKQTVLRGIPRALAYNQSANQIETEYYGENLKGVIARLGNVEKTYTYNLAFLSDIPKVGTKFDSDYYISAVSTEILPSYIRCTVSLSKDFNRLSEYVGISSEKRMWEVSERQSYARDSVITDYIIARVNNYGNLVNDSYLSKGNHAEMLFNKSNITDPISAVRTEQYSKKGNQVGNNDILLPVLGCAMGNSMLFNFSFDDNYSAGQKLVKSNDEGLEGYWGDYIPYNDYYGRFYYLKFMLYANSLELDGKSKELPEGAIDDGLVIAETKTPIVYRKDNREQPSITYEITIVSDNEKLIIGSGLTKNCKLVNRNATQAYKVYFFKKELNLIKAMYTEEELADLMVDTDWGRASMDYYFTTKGAVLTFNVPDDDKYFERVANMKSWAIITNPEYTEQIVENENGEKETQYIPVGGEFVLGGNFALKSGDEILFTAKRYIYD